MRSQCSVEPLPDLKSAFDSALSRELADCVEADGLLELLRLLADRGLASADLGRWLTFELDEDDRERKERKRMQKKRGCCCGCCGGGGCCSDKPPNPHKGNDFRTIVHMCLYYQSADIFQHVAECQPSLLLAEDTDGNNLLHSLAKARVLIDTYSSQLTGFGDSADPLARFDEFEALVIKLLTDIPDPTSTCTSSFESAETSSGTSCLLTLCRAENAQRLRPLEFAMNVGAYKTFNRLAEIDGYLVAMRSCRGANTYVTYDLSEYDLVSGERRDRSPLLMLTLLPTSRVDALVKSGITDQPLLRQWGRRARRDLMPLNVARTVLFAILTLLVSPLTPFFPFIATMVQYGSEVHDGFYTYAWYVNNTLYNQTGNYSEISAEDLKWLCQGKNILHFLRDTNHKGSEVVKTSPIFWFQTLQRADLISQAHNNLIIVSLLLALQLFAICFNSLERRRFNRQPWLQKHTGESYVQCSFYRSAYHLAFLCGILHLAFTLPIDSYLDCTDWLTKNTPNTALWWFKTIAETTAVLYIYFSMVSLMEAFELIGERVAFLNICFRKMCSRFLRVLPLFFIWAYIVFGTVMYMVDFENSEFKTAAYVYYSPLRILLNMATLTSRPSTAILHTLFVLVVSINITNFLIAIVSNEFEVADRHFRLLYILTKFNYMLVTWRRYGRLLRLVHRQPRKLLLDTVKLQLE